MASSKYDNMLVLNENGKLIHRMTPAERAKIFVPFDPLKGFQEALREKEREVAQRDVKLFSPEPFDDQACSTQRHSSRSDCLPLAGADEEADA